MERPKQFHIILNNIAFTRFSQIRNNHVEAWNGPKQFRALVLNIKILQVAKILSSQSCYFFLQISPSRPHKILGPMHYELSRA